MKNNNIKQSVCVGGWAIQKYFLYNVLLTTQLLYISQKTGNE